jgi:FkbM family methyltransferase
MVALKYTSSKLIKMGWDTRLLSKLTKDEILSISDIGEFENRRILMTISCEDASSIPKIASAGEVIVENDEPQQIMHNGLRIIKGCYYGNWMTIIIKLLNGHHEPQEEFTFFEILKQLKLKPSKWGDPSILEIGSFWSYYSMWFMKENQSGKAFCIEPDPNYLAVGKKNFGLNSLTAEFKNFQVGTKDSENSSFLCESTGQILNVPTLTFSSILKNSGNTNFDIVLADIQGAEISMLENLSDALKVANIRFMLISTHDMQITGSPTTHQDCLYLLRKHGARIVAEHSVSESFSGDGLILASFSDLDRDLQVKISFNRSKLSLFGEWEPRIAHIMAQQNAQIFDGQDYKSELEKIQNSKSWKKTKPVRFISRFLRNL